MLKSRTITQCLIYYVLAAGSTCTEQAGWPLEHTHCAFRLNYTSLLFHCNQILTGANAAMLYVFIFLCVFSWSLPHYVNLPKGICIEYFFSICQYTAVPVSTDSFPFNYVSYKDYPELCSVPYNLLGRKILKQFIQKCYGFFTLPTLKLANTLLLLMAITKTHSLSGHFSQLLHNLPIQCHMLFSKLNNAYCSNKPTMHALPMSCSPDGVSYIEVVFIFHSILPDRKWATLPFTMRNW